MALPRIDTPKYQLELPSTGEKINYRPFLVKEQKIIMLAQESKDNKQITKAMSDLVKSCTFDKVDAENSPIFDIEYIFLKVRSKSVGETVDINLICPDDQVTQVPVKINLDDIDIQITEDHTKEIKITENVKLHLKYPILSDMESITGDNSVTGYFEVFNKIIERIHYGDDVYHRVDMTDDDIEEFIDQLNSEQFERITDFFNTMPKLRHVVEITNPKTQVKSEVALEGLSSFLG